MNYDKFSRYFPGKITINGIEICYDPKIMIEISPFFKGYYGSSDKYFPREGSIEIKTATGRPIPEKDIKNYFRSVHIYDHEIQPSSVCMAYLMRFFGHCGLSNQFIKEYTKEDLDDLVLIKELNVNWVNVWDNSTYFCDIRINGDNYRFIPHCIPGLTPGSIITDDDIDEGELGGYFANANYSEDALIFASKYGDKRLVWMLENYDVDDNEVIESDAICAILKNTNFNKDVMKAMRKLEITFIPNNSNISTLLTFLNYIQNSSKES